MALHRDIYWVGRQWAVTGFGVQAIDQRLKGAFDIEASQVWQDGLQARVCGQPWFNAQDFDKALTMARRRLPQPPKPSIPLVESVLDLMQPPASGPSQEPLGQPASGAGAQPLGSPQSPQLLQPTPPALPQLRVEGKLARFMPQWRLRR